MTLYTILKFLHILMAITAVGANLTYGLWFARAAREPAHLAFALRGVKVLDDRIANPAYGLLLLTGLAMVWVGDVSLTTPWILTALILFVLIVVAAFTAMTPLFRRQMQVLEAQGAASAEFQALSRRAQVVGIAITVAVLVILFLMVTKPRLWG